MGSTAILADTLRHTHEDLADRLRVLTDGWGPPGGSDAVGSPPRGYAPIDELVTAASRHVHAVTEVLLPPLRRGPAPGRQVARGCCDAARRLEVVLAHVKAHEYGSIYEKRFPWSAVWAEVAEALDDYRAHEEEVVARLLDTCDDDQLDELGRRLLEVEPGEPTRPHPYLPHTGVLGSLARRVVRRTDRAWDHAEGRPVPGAPRAARRRPGLLGQYLLCDPRLEPADRSAEERRPG